jgi:hypothetical protein
MKKKTRKKRPTCKELPPPVIPVGLKAFINVNEERWLVRRMKFADIYNEIVGSSWNMKKSDLRCVLWHHCEVYGKTKLRRESKALVLDEAGWDRVKIAAESLQSKFASMTLDECIVLMRTRVSVNKAQMLGLPKRLRTWIKKK